MRIEQFVGFGDQLFVKPLLTDTRLVARNQKDARSIRIERERNTHHLVRRISPKLLHVGMLRSIERIRMRPCQSWPKQLQQFHFGDDFGLAICVQIGKPNVKFIGSRHFPHEAIIARRLYSVNSF